MNVRDLMTRDVAACTPDSDLSAAAMLMWQNDCGAVAVVNDQGRAVGMITDRDIAIAAGSRHASTDQIRVADVINGRLVAVQPDDDVRAALEAMREAQVRRLLVTNLDGKLAGVLSINDVILAAHAGNGKSRSGVPSDEVLRAMQTICRHRTASREPVHAG